MLSILLSWIKGRQQIRARWKADAACLIQADERHAYYNAQRLAARAKAGGDESGFFHWAKVAAEVARRSPHAEMDFKAVEAIVSEELSRSAEELHH